MSRLICALVSLMGNSCFHYDESYSRSWIKQKTHLVFFHYHFNITTNNINEGSINYALLIKFYHFNTSQTLHIFQVYFRYRYTWADQKAMRLAL